MIPPPLGGYPAAGRYTSQRRPMRLVTWAAAVVVPLLISRIRGYRRRRCRCGNGSVPASQPPGAAGSGPRYRRRTEAWELKRVVDRQHGLRACIVA